MLVKGGPGGNPISMAEPKTEVIAAVGWAIDIISQADKLGIVHEKYANIKITFGHILNWLPWPLILFENKIFWSNII